MTIGDLETRAGIGPDHADRFGFWIAFMGEADEIAKTAICVVSEHGNIIKEAEVASEPESLLAWLQALDGNIAALASRLGPCHSGCIAG